jgi:ribosomal protein S18 acetylase RimI-like enzyme
MPAPQICLRPATKDDVPFLLALRQETMDAHLFASGLVPSVEEHLQRVLYRLDCARIVQLAGEAVGLLKVSRDDSDWCLIQIQLGPRLQGQGLGRQLIQSVIDEARKAGASLRLGVLKANPAFHLYQRLGFTVVGESIHAYEMRLEGNCLRTST